MEMDMRDQIIQVATDLFMEIGFTATSTRQIAQILNISQPALYHHFKNKDDLLIYFVRETSFDRFILGTPLQDIAGRVVELYMHLISRYLEMGEEFMKHFYTTGNKALSAYMGEEDGHYADGTVMARCEQEINDAIGQEVLRPDTDAHRLSMDICTIVKGCVFEWALNDGAMDIEKTLSRIVSSYLTPWMR